MARKALVVKEAKKRLIGEKFREHRAQLKKTALNFSINEEERARARLKLSQLPRDASPTRHRNRCRLTGRSRGYLRRFQVSRLCFRELASMGLIPGVVKASW